MKRKIYIALLCVLLFFPVHSARSQETIHLAGSFNNWNPQDPDYLMLVRGKDQYEITKLLYPGLYTFKFNKNATWEVNWGAGPKEGELALRGNDIKTTVKDPAYYKFTLDLAGNSYAVEKIPPPASIPFVKFERYYFMTDFISFDASPSIPGTGKKISKYLWYQPESNPQKVCYCQLENKSKPSFRLNRPGIYEYFLTLNDGEKSSPFAVRFEVINKYSLVVDSMSTNYLEYKGNKKYEVILAPDSTGSHKFQLVMNNNQVIQDDISRKFEKNQYYLFSYNSESDDFNFEKKNYARFYFNRKDYPEYRDRSLLSVAVAGPFNNWSMTGPELKKLNEDEYLLYWPLEQGVYYYKFVIDGKEWVYDKRSDEHLKVPDNYNGFNSGVYVGDQGKDYGPIVKQGINQNACEHDPANARYFNMVNDRLVQIRLRVLENDAEKVILLWREKEKKSKGLEKSMTQSGFDYYTVLVPFSGKPKELDYCFLLEDGGKRIFYANDYFSEKEPGEKEYFRADLVMKFPTPDWAKGIVWYQIMLDRFRNGEKKNDPECTIPWDWDWFRKYPCEKWDEKKFNDKQNGFYGGNGVWGRFFGGDIQGLMDKLDYLKELGVGGIYLNPVFESPSYHKYDTKDYRHIDDHFGFLGDQAGLNETLDQKTWQWTRTDRLFLDLIKKAHSMNIRIILDGVFNHSGDQFWAFEDLRSKKEGSLYKDWYMVTSWDPFQYQGWFGFSGLPVYRKTEDGLTPGIQQHIFDITRRWMDPNKDGNPEDGIDGWRLDVPNEVPHGFWKKWRALVKSINKDAFITGEIWENAGAWLAGDEFDSVMNYPFAKLVFAFFIHTKGERRIPASVFDRSLKNLLDSYPLQVDLVLQNLLGSHDTERIASGIKNPDRDYEAKNRLQDGDLDFNIEKPGPREKQVLKLIQVFQFTFPGSPMIYYGDEVGMWGADDPHNRQPMFWNDLNNKDLDKDLLAYIRKVAQIHNTYKALRTGAFSSFLIDDSRGLYGYVRSLEEQNVYVILNNSQMSQDVRVNLGMKKIMDVLNGRNFRSDSGEYNFSIGPKSGAILVAE